MITGTLTPVQQAILLGVSVETIRAYRWRYGPDHPTPYPPRDTSGRVSRAALTEWQDRRAAHRGRPRHMPPGLTPQQWRDLRRVADGVDAAPAVVARLALLGLVRVVRGEVTLTRHGRTLVTQWSTREGGAPVTGCPPSHAGRGAAGTACVDAPAAEPHA